MSEVEPDVHSKFYYVYSSDLNLNLQIKVGNLEGTRKQPNYQEQLNEPLLRFSGVCQETPSDLYVTAQVFTEGKPLCLPVRTSYKHFSTRWSWNEWLSLPVKYSDLPRSAQLYLTIWDCMGPGRTAPVGGTAVSLFGKRGCFREGIHDLRIWADQESSAETPGKASTSQNHDSMHRLAKLSKKHHCGHMLRVDWLDRLTFREIEHINEREKRESNLMYLMVEFPCIEFEGKQHSVVYFEPDGDEFIQVRTQADIVHVPDVEISLENLVEGQHQKLARSVRWNAMDGEVKPNAAIRDSLHSIISRPPTAMLSSEEQDLIWKYRFYLSKNKKALGKFLQCVPWQLRNAASQAVDLIRKWSPMDPEDALELLGPHFTQQEVRRYAITRLSFATDEDLLLYLLQLVQALKYEHFEELQLTPPTIIQTQPSQEGNDSSEEVTLSGDNLSQEQPIENQDLSSFLICRCSSNLILANYFYWYLMVECEDSEGPGGGPQRWRDMYASVLKRFTSSLSAKLRNLINQQHSFVTRLVQLLRTVQSLSGNRKRKIEHLQQLLSEPEGNKMNLARFDPLPFPLDPDVCIRGLIPEKASLFKSALMPVRLTCMTEDAEYVCIFKHGDDLRQDQLILQMITLMDRLLRRENLDLKLTPYRVLPTSSKHGFVQFVESVPIAEITSNGGTIQNFFKKHNPCETGPYGILPEVMDTYIRSCAGYCVLTYLLGVGDRHLDNLLISKCGRLFHIDFGFILGRDPKPMPPPMKLSKEMVEAMGGLNSEHYQEFRKQCYTAFLHLRRHSNLILNLFALMVDASVPDIALEPDKTVRKVQDKFRLDLSDEEAVAYMHNIIDVSVTAVMAVLVEQIHKIAQYWRR